jgi:hypothetical protein
LKSGDSVFAVDPSLSALEADICWSPLVDPATIVLTPACLGGTARSLSEQAVSRIERIAGAPENVCRLQLGDDRFVLLLDGPVDLSGGLASIVALDDLTADRIEMLARFWLVAGGGSTPADPRLTAQRRARLQQMLQAIDAHTHSQSYRSIAQALFPRHRIDSAGWAGNALRETTIRLVRDGLALVLGGYVALLRRGRKRR